MGMFIHDFGFIYIIELKRICDGLALDLKSQWTYWDLRVNHIRTYGSNHSGTFGSIILGPTGQITVGPSGQIILAYWKSWTDTRLNLSQNNKLNIEAYAYGSEIVYDI